MSKTIVILTGKSGVGKTTSIIPTLVELLDAECFETGMVFKAMLGLAREPFYVSPEIKHVPKSKEALRWFYESGSLARGLEAYERAKRTNLSGYQICLAAEANLRSVCPSGSAQQVALLAGFSKKETIITDAINEEELGYLLSAFAGQNVVLVNLDCENPVKRDGDNREPISREFQLKCADRVWFVTESYRLENSKEAAKKLASRVKVYSHPAIC